ncbi:tail fiber domain-containing protein, partial [Candidatus Saccharibacteria bacterium]|nr:tail fiber domain-containing protein [Candidatus Saccharibacteria bacterium]
NSTSFGRRMNVSGNYSFGVSLNDTALSVTDANSFVINAGYVGINTASPLSYASAFSVVGNGYSYGSTITSTGIASRVRAGDNSSGTLIQFERADATVVGSITHNGANTAYNTASDARLKHDVVDTNYSLDTVLQLKIHDYKYNADSTNTTYTGFIAQELQKLFPDAVSVMDTKTGYLGVDYGKLTPLLAKGIQDLNTKVDGLQTQLDALKTTSTPSVVPIDVVAELAKVSAITINGDLTVNGKVIVVGNLELKGDNTGVIKIPAGLTRVHLSFTKPFTTAPNVTLTAKGLTKATYAVDGETTTGFDVILDAAQTQETLLNYHAL